MSTGEVFCAGRKLEDRHQASEPLFAGHHDTQLCHFLHPELVRALLVSHFSGVEKTKAQLDKCWVPVPQLSAVSSLVGLEIVTSADCH